jgi:hypothetical protein
MSRIAAQTEFVMFALRLSAKTTRLRPMQFNIALSVLIAMLALLVRPSPFAFPLDDAYITLHNASVLLFGPDRNYGVSPLIGATSQIHLLLVAATMMFTDPLNASYLVSVAAAMLFATGLARIAFQLGCSMRSAALFVALGFLTGFAPFQLLNGLETGLAMAAVTWAFSLAMNPRPSLALPVLCGLLPFVRPELGALSVVLMVRQSWIRFRAGERASIARDGAIALLVAMPFIVWMWMSTGSPFVQTAMAKRFFFAEQHAPWTRKALSMSGGLLQSGMLPLAIIACLGYRSRLAIPAALYVLSLLGAWYMMFPGGVTHNGSRYLFVLFPAFLLLALDFLRTAKSKTLWIIVLIGSISLMFPGVVGAYRSGIAFTAKEQTSLAQWLDDNLPADARILIHDAGYPAYATPFRFIDVVGLKTPESMRFHRACTAPSNGLDRPLAVSSIALANRVNYAIILHDKSGFWYSIKHDLESTGWTLRLLRPASVIGGYEVFALTPPASRALPCGKPEWAN